MLARIVLNSVVTSTCISGNQLWNGHRGNLIANIINKNNHILNKIKKLSKKLNSLNIVKLNVLKWNISNTMALIQHTELQAE